MAESMHAKRTDRCGNLRREDVGRTVTLCGWVAKRRNLGSLLFIDLRDVSGVAQITFDDTVDKGLFDKANGVRSEYCLCVTGKVRERGDVFELTEERFAEINAKLPNFIEEVEEKKTKKASSKEEEKD